MPLELREIQPEPPGLPEDAGQMRATAQGKAQASPTLKDALRRKFQDLEKTRFGDFDIPGYDGMLVARYRRLTTEELVALAEHQPELRENDTRAVARVSPSMNADFLAAACQELFGRDENGQLHSLGDGFPMRYDAQFAEIMGYEVTPEQGAREVVLRTFDHNELALKAHTDEVDDWMSSLTVHVDEKSVGK